MDNKLLKFDLPSVLEDNLLESIAKQCGWNNNENNIEHWLLSSSEKNICVYLLLEKDCDTNNLYFIKGIKNNKENINQDIKTFTIPLIMCKENFINKIIKLCGYQDDYNSDIVIKYLIECQLKSKNDDYTRIYIDIPL